MAELRKEILQQSPFASLEEEALLNMMRTADCLSRTVQRATRPWGITATQYNVLRILRGAQPEGLTCSAIGDRMITSDPDITRLLARLKARKLVRQQRDKNDKRVLWNHISQAGLHLLAEMDPAVRKAPKELLGHFSAAELNEFVRLLERARSHCENAQLSVTCDGNAGEGQVVCAS